MAKPKKAPCDGCHQWVTRGKPAVTECRWCGERQPVYRVVAAKGADEWEVVSDGLTLHQAQDEAATLREAGELVLIESE
jgi:hypothetical protein